MNLFFQASSFVLEHGSAFLPTGTVEWVHNIKFKGLHSITLVLLTTEVFFRWRSRPAVDLWPLPGDAVCFGLVYTDSSLCLFLVFIQPLVLGPKLSSVLSHGCTASCFSSVQSHLKQDSHPSEGRVASPPLRHHAHWQLVVRCVGGIVGCMCSLCIAIRSCLWG